jgi:hypothetical protein
VSEKRLVRSDYDVRAQVVASVKPFMLRGNGSSQQHSEPAQPELLPVDRREALLDAQSASLIEHIRNSLSIQREMFRRILNTTPKPPIVLAELLEDAGNRYIDFSERVSTASRCAHTD